MDRIGQSRGALRIISVALSFLLAFGVLTTLPTTAYADDQYVCMIGDVGYRTIDEAVSSSRNGATIKLLANIDRTMGGTEVTFEGNPWCSASLFIGSKSITIDTNGFVLNVGRYFDHDSYGNDFSEAKYCTFGIWVINGGRLNLIDSSPQQTGQLNATGYYPVYVGGTDSMVTVSNVVGVGGRWVLAQHGGSITVTGDITGSAAVAAKAENGSSITVMGNVSANAATALLATGSGSSIEVHGDVTSVSSAGSSGSVINATEDASIKVHGNVSSDASSGVLAEGADTTVEIKGNLSAAQGTGVQAVGGATVSIDGTLTASYYIKLGTSSDDITLYPKESGRTSQRKPNYYEYTDNTNYVYVRSDGSIIDNSAGIPGSGDLYGRGYASMDVALVAARVVVGAEVSLTPAQFAAIDMDFDGALTMTDVLLIMRKACGL